jgi:hypothetical protein
LRCAAHRKLSNCRRRLRSYFFAPIPLTTIGGDVLCSSTRRNACSLRSGLAVAFVFETHTGETTVSGKKPRQGIFPKNRTIAAGWTG